MKIGLFGGSFNPVHNGHINVARALAHELGLDKVIIMPAHIPPHKEAVNLASTKARLDMCNIAFKDDERFIVSDYEILRDEKSYTINTLRYLKEQYPDDELYLLTGGDMLLYFRRWYRWASIGKLATIVGAPRHKKELDLLNEEAEKLKMLGIDVLIVPIEVKDVSSTEVRRAIRNEEDTSHMIPREVASYIFENSLYTKE